MSAVDLAAPFAAWGTILTWAGVALGVGTLVYAIVLALSGVRRRRRGAAQLAEDRFRGANFAAVTGGGLLAVVGILHGIPTIVRAVLSIDSQTAGMINATITAVSLAVVAVCAVLIVLRSRNR